MKTSAPLFLYVSFFLALTAHGLFSFQNQQVKALWTNVPPVPRVETASLTGLGDAELSYRLIALMIQNLGDTGGQVTPLQDYDYDRLSQWFYIAHTLSPHSAHVTYLAAYYFSAVQKTEKLRPLIGYLETAGESDDPGSWRWLAQAAYLARFELKDTDLALKIATRLAAREEPGIPVWTRQLPAFIMNAEGKKEAAYDILASLLENKQKTLPPQEIMAMRDYICRRILKPDEAALNALCNNLNKP